MPSLQTVKSEFGSSAWEPLNSIEKLNGYKSKSSDFKVFQVPKPKDVPNISKGVNADTNTTPTRTIEIQTDVSFERYHEERELCKFSFVNFFLINNSRIMLS